ncbi:MAG: potassium/proton antiporter [Ignavibacteriales bacterium]|nr:potassium/proton antiporter [Ignavibacteriales bacterium]
MLSFEYLILIASSLILLSIAIAKFSDNLGVPTLLLFLGIGMLAGSDGPGGIYFDDAKLSQSIGIVALIFILFAGGLDTKWNEVRPVLKEASILATLGVLITALSIALLMVYVFNLSFLNGLLLGAIVSSTDAAAVFSVLRSKNVSLKGNLKPLLELESGSNDPMAVFLTIGTLQMLTIADTAWSDIVLLFFYQMGIGALFGFGFAKGMVLTLNRLKFSYEGIYPVLAIAFAGFTYAATALVNGSGFLAVYIAGLVVGNSDIIQKKSLLRFFDGLSWLGQIAMFLTLGLLAFPHQLVTIIGSGMVISLFLILIARPLGVFLSLAVSRFSTKEKIFISWVGLRGAVPIVLATFPLLAKTPDAQILFNIVFFIVLTSALLQGWSLPVVAKILGLDQPMKKKRNHPIEFAAMENSDTQLVDIVIPFNSDVIGRPIVELGLPGDSLVVLISRSDNFVVPSGGTSIEDGDTLLVLVNKHNLPAVREIFSRQKVKE